MKNRLTLCRRLVACDRGDPTQRVASLALGSRTTEERCYWMNDNALIAVSTASNTVRRRSTHGHPQGEIITTSFTRRRNITECHDSRSLVSADCGSDHQMVWAKMTGILWNSKKPRKTVPSYKLQKLKERSAEYEEKVMSDFNMNNNTEEMTRNKRKRTLLEKLEVVCPK